VGPPRARAPPGESNPPPAARGTSVTWGRDGRVTDGWASLAVGAAGAEHAARTGFVFVFFSLLPSPLLFPCTGRLHHAGRLLLQRWLFGWAAGCWLRATGCTWGPRGTTARCGRRAGGVGWYVAGACRRLGPGARSRGRSLPLLLYCRRVPPRAARDSGVPAFPRAVGVWGGGDPRTAWRASHGLTGARAGGRKRRLTAGLGPDGPDRGDGTRPNGVGGRMFVLCGPTTSLWGPL
jgi:hypothetical protein